jgi:hypothetical protein
MCIKGEDQTSYISSFTTCWVCNLPPSLLPTLSYETISIIQLMDITITLKASSVDMYLTILSD